MKAYYMSGETLTKNWCIDATVSDIRLDLRLNSFYNLEDGAKIYDRLAEITITISDIAEHAGLADNARFIVPLNKSQLVDEKATGELFLNSRDIFFEPVLNLQKLAFDQNKDHNEVLLELQKPVAVCLFVPFSQGLVNFLDCSIGFMLGDPGRVKCNIPVETVSRFHQKDVWYKPAVEGPLTVQKDGQYRYAVSALFRGEATDKPCKLSVRTSAGTLDATNFTLEGKREITLDTSGLKTGDQIELSVSPQYASKHGTAAAFMIKTLTITVE